MNLDIVTLLLNQLDDFAQGLWANSAGEQRFNKENGPQSMCVEDVYLEPESELTFRRDAIYVARQILGKTAVLPGCGPWPNLGIYSKEHVKFHGCSSLPGTA